MERAELALCLSDSRAWERAARPAPVPEERDSKPEDRDDGTPGRVSPALLELESRPANAPGLTGFRLGNSRL